MCDISLWINGLRKNMAPLILVALIGHYTRTITSSNRISWILWLPVSTEVKKLHGWTQHVWNLFLKHSLHEGTNSQNSVLLQVLCRRVAEPQVSHIMEQDRQCTYKRNIEAHSCNHFCCGKAISITYSERVSVALVIQHAKRMRRIILSSVTCLALPHFSTLCYKRHDFRKKLLNMKYVFWFSLQNLP
jgi:hypothetical protein